MLNFQCTCASEEHAGLRSGPWSSQGRAAETPGTRIRSACWANAKLEESSASTSKFTDFAFPESKEFNERGELGAACGQPGGSLGDPGGEPGNWGGQDGAQIQKK